MKTLSHDASHLVPEAVTSDGSQGPDIGMQGRLPRDANLTPSQFRALRWIGEFPTTKAAWTVDGKSIKRQHPDTWNFMKIEGADGSILVHKDDLAAIRPYVQHCTSPDKLYALNNAGLALVSTPRGE